jgi:hypothetical protein
MMSEACSSHEREKESGKYSSHARDEVEKN